MRPKHPILAGLAGVMIAAIVVAAGAPISLASLASCGPAARPAPSSCGREGGACCCAAKGGMPAPSSCPCEIAPVPPARERGALTTGFELPAPRVAPFAPDEESASLADAWHEARLCERDVGPPPPPSQPLYALISLLLI